MRAARWHGPRDVRVEAVPDPELGDPHDVLVAVDVATICGSDLAEWRDGPHVIPTTRPHRLTGKVAPITLGHEYVGRVVETGPAVTGFSPGDRVCGDACLRCGVCYWCRRGEYNICEVGASVGLHSDGAFAPLLAVPDYTLTSVPAHVCDQHAALVEPLAVALHALRRAQFDVGDAVVVVGTGMIGASAVALAQAMGARQIIAVDRSIRRRQLAARLGAHDAVDPSQDDVRATVRRQTDGRGADAVLDCTGHAGALGSAVELARRGGKIVVCGIAHQPSTLSSDRLVYFERELIGSLGYRYDHETTVALVASGRLRLDEMVGSAINLDDIVTAGLMRMDSDAEAPLRIPVHVR
jgi:(R,R)-butanediol dehydrogenase/meso-butanediol dehydrogenase/diacetyl reductase